MDSATVLDCELGSVSGLSSGSVPYRNPDRATTSSGVPTSARGESTASMAIRAGGWSMP